MLLLHLFFALIFAVTVSTNCKFRTLCGSCWCSFTRLISPVWWHLQHLALRIQCTPLTLKGLLVVRATLSVSPLFPTGCPQSAKEAHHIRGQLATCNKLLCFDFSAAVAMWRSSKKTSLQGLVLDWYYQYPRTYWLNYNDKAYSHWVNE